MDRPEKDLKNKIVDLKEKSFNKNYLSELRNKISEMSLYRQALECSNEMVIIVRKRNGIITKMSDSALRLLGLTKMVSGLKIHEVLSGTDRQKTEKLLDPGKNNFNETLPSVIKDAEGKPHHVEFSIFDIFPGNEKMVCFLGKSSSSAAGPGPSENDRLLLLETLLETIPHPIYYKNTKAQYVGGNKHFSELLGIPPAELAGKNMWDLKNYDLDDYYDIIERTDREVLETGTYASYQIRIKDIKGKYRNFLVNKSAFRNSNGEIEGLIAILTDITEQINATLKAEEGEKKLLSLLEILQETYFETSLEGKLTSINSSIEKFSGYKAEEILGKPLSNFYANYADRAYYLEKLGEKGFIKDYEIKLKDKEGELRRALINSRLVRNEHGEIEKIVGSLKDVTDTYKYQQALEESEKKYRILLENAGSQILFTDPAGRIILINKLAAAFLGKDAEELKGMNISQAFEKDHAEQLIKQINNVLINKKRRIEEILLDNSNGRFWFLSTFQPVLNEPGEVAGIVVISNDITERKQAETEMAKLTQAIEQSTALILITDTTGRIEYVNPRYTEVTGYNLSELRGKEAFILTQFRKTFQEYLVMKKNLHEGKVHEGEYQNKKKDGEYFREKVIISPVFGADNLITNYVIVSEDITESHKAKEKERIIRENLVILNDTALNILKVNPKQNIYKLIGEQLKELLPVSIFSVCSYNKQTNSLKKEFIYSHKSILNKFANLTQIEISSGSRTVTEELKKTLLTGKMHVETGGLYELMMGKIPRLICSKIEKTFDLSECHIRGITGEDNLYGAISVIRLDEKKIDNHLLDNFLTQASLGIERKNLEDELVEAKNTAEEMNRIKTVFLANMSHELRTPLNGILGFSELLTEQIKDPRHREMLEVVHKSGLRLLDTLNTILDLSTIEAKSIDLDYEKENIVETVREVILNHLEEANKKSLSLIYSPSAEEITGYTVKEILQKVIRNLLNNAIKFTTQGKVSVTLKEKMLRKQPWVEIQVIDTGIGIPKEELHEIFHEFRQGSEGFTRRFEGTGLGLTLSKKFTDLLRGNLSVKSQPGKGSVFTLEIPVFENPVEHNETLSV